MNIVCFHNPDEDNGYLSNWYPSPFTVDGVAFSSMEQFMMYRKAICFGDEAVAAQILSTSDVAKIKSLGRQVSNYDESMWNGIRQIVVCEGLLAKFSQNDELKAKLKATGNAVLAECAVKDCIWGIGLSMKDPDRLNKAKWNGQNLLGYALMMVRERLQQDYSWEQRKVGELLIERNEQAPMSEEYPLMAFIANEGVAPKGERYDRSSLVTDTENKLYKKTECGDFIYSSNNLETGSIGLNKYGKACISPVYSIFQPTGIADSNFLGRRLVRKDFINSMVKWRQGVIYGQWRIHESDFLKIEIPVPSVEEQKQIGTFLDYLDHLITLHQRELEKLQNIKKSMLEKMFVQEEKKNGKNNFISRYS